MIQWLNIKLAAKSTIVSLLALQPSQVRWRDEAEGGAWTNSPALWLRLFGLGEIGHAEELRYNDPSTPDADAVVTVTQQKRFTLSVRAESFEQKIQGIAHAGSMLETLKTRLRRTSSVEKLAGIFAIAQYLPTRFVDYVDENNRQVSAYVMDLSCLTVDNDVDSTTGAGGWINEVKGTGTINDAVSTPISVPIDVSG